MRVALLGCTGQIGRCLVRALATQHELKLYARRPQIIQDWISARGLPAEVFHLAALPSGTFELIINAIGDGAPGKIRAAGARILETTAHFDRLCLDHLDYNPGCAYVFISSGRVYGENYEAAQGLHPQPLSVERLTTQPYPLAKRMAELRHRERGSQRIADIRIFGYVSDEIDLDDDFLISQMLRAAADGADFVTTEQDFVRDYVGPEDLVDLIGRLLAAGVPNSDYDLCSASPITKFEMLEALAREFGLRYTVESVQSQCKERPQKISCHAGTQAVGYIARHTSLENVLAAADAILWRQRNPDRRRAP